MNITLHCEQQIKVLHSIPAEQRVLHIDATGQLVYVAKYMKKYPKIMNYAFIVKDSLNLEEFGLLINETITSRQDAYSIGDMLRLFKFNYLSIYPNAGRIFQMVIVDLSWATIHATLEVLNLETVNNYSSRIYKFAKGEVSEADKNLTRIGSCASHTMHRFTKQLKKK